MAHIFSFTIMTYFKNSLELDHLIQNSIQQDYLLESYSLPLLQKDSKIKWFWLIITGSCPLYKDDRGSSYVYFSKKIEVEVHFSHHKRIVYYERIIYDCGLSLYFQIQETL